MPEIRITGIGSELQGVGRLPDGRAVFVPGALPEETVRIGITAEKDRFCEARLEEVLEPSVHRAPLSCPYADRCGGCQARHMDYAYSLELKRQIVVNAITRIGGVESPEVYDTLGCDASDRTRNKAEYPVDGRLIGVYMGRSRTILPVEDCLLQHPASVRAMRALRDLLPVSHLRFLVTRVNRKGGMMLTLCADAPVQDALKQTAEKLRRALPECESVYMCLLNRRYAHALDGRCTLLWGKTVLRDTLNGLDFDLAPQAFFQVNPPQAERLYRKAIEGIGGARNVLDAYCGAGTITLSAAQTGCFATGIEIVPPAIENANANARLNRLSGRVKFLCADAGKAIQKLIREGQRFDAAILDPPRKGADAALLNALIAAKVPRIAYVSCDPGTLARDIRILRGGGYAFRWAQPVDMFPGSSHIECAILMTRER